MVIRRMAKIIHVMIINVMFIGMMVTMAVKVTTKMTKNKITSSGLESPDPVWELILLRCSLLSLEEGEQELEWPPASWYWLLVFDSLSSLDSLEWRELSGKT